MELVKVAIVDDHKLVSKALENMISLNPHFQVIMNCFNGQDFIDELHKIKTHPDVVLMDINMPIKNGIDTTTEISRDFPNLKVIALTMEDNESTIIKMLKAGAKGYLLKDMSPDILFNADIFLIIGTSMQVYPAAGLIDYIPAHCKVFIIDPNLENRFAAKENFFKTSATEGMKKLKEILLSNYLT